MKSWPLLLVFACASCVEAPPAGRDPQALFKPRPACGEGVASYVADDGSQFGLSLDLRARTATLHGSKAEYEDQETPYSSNYAVMSFGVLIFSNMFIPFEDSYRDQYNFGKMVCTSNQTVSGRHIRCNEGGEPVSEIIVAPGEGLKSFKVYHAGSADSGWAYARGQGLLANCKKQDFKSRDS